MDQPPMSSWQEPSLPQALSNRPDGFQFISPETPANLRHWFNDSLILFWIEQEIQIVGSQLPEINSHAGWQPDGHPQRMLCLLAFALSTSLLSSQEIARACRSDPVLHRLSPGSAPFPHELSTWRRRYRPVLQRILAGVFIQAISQKFDLASALLPPELLRDLYEHAAERLDSARHLDDSESC